MDKEQKINAIVKAIGYAENGGKPDTSKLKAGKTGELKSIFQFTPSTWRGYSKEVFGKEMPLTPDNETYVVSNKVSKWLDKGWDTKQIASAWNAGEGEKDAHTGKFSDGSPSRSINKKYNVRFDVPSYASKVDSYATSFLKGDNQQAKPTSNTSNPMDTIKQLLQISSSKGEMAQAPKQTGGLMQGLAGKV